MSPISVLGRVSHWPQGRVSHWPQGRVSHWPHGRVSHWPQGRVSHWSQGRVSHWGYWVWYPTGDTGCGIPLAAVGRVSHWGYRVGYPTGGGVVSHWALGRVSHWYWVGIPLGYWVGIPLGYWECQFATGGIYTHIHTCARRSSIGNPTSPLPSAASQHPATKKSAIRQSDNRESRISNLGFFGL